MNGIVVLRTLPLGVEYVLAPTTTSEDAAADGQQPSPGCVSSLQDRLAGAQCRRELKFVLKKAHLYNDAAFRKLFRETKCLSISWVNRVGQLAPFPAGLVSALLRCAYVTHTCGDEFHQGDVRALRAASE